MTPSRSGEMTAARRFEIEALRPAGPVAGVAGSDVETPAAGAPGKTWALPVSGWVVGATGPAARVLVTAQDGLRWELPVHDYRSDIGDRHPERAWARNAGFSGAIGTLRLPARFELDVTAQLGDGVLAPLGRISGRRAPLHGSHEPRLQPILITTLGRTGSTWLLHLLSAHPDIAAYRPFAFEPRAATYWVDVLTSLADPSSYSQQVDGDVHYPGPWWLGHGARMTSEDVPDPDLARWLGTDNIDDIVCFAQERIDAFYLRVAALADKRPRFFAEKCLPQNNVAALVRELYPDAREIFLVRDFRDMFTSIRCFSEKRGVPGFGLDGAPSDSGYVQDVLSPSVASLVREWRRRAGSSYLLRYEDLVSNPADAVAGVLAYLDADRSPATLDEMLARAHSEIPEMGAHRTSVSASKSIGRWRRELPEDLGRLCNDAFGPALRELGYA